MPKLNCDFNQTIPLQPRTLGAARHKNSTLRRYEAGAFELVDQSCEGVVVSFIYFFGSSSISL